MLALVPELRCGCCVHVMQQTVCLSRQAETFFVLLTATAALPDDVKRAARGNTGTDVARDVCVVAADQLRLRADR